MANQATAYGLRPIGLVGSAVNSTGLTQYEIAGDNTNAIYNCEIVVPLAGGVIDQAADTAVIFCCLTPPWQRASRQLCSIQ